jgi:hypothetical protein
MNKSAEIQDPQVFQPKIEIVKKKNNEDEGVHVEDL